MSPQIAELLAFTETPPPPVTLDRLLTSLDEAPAFAPRPVELDVLEELYALLALGPSLADASPARVLFLSSDTAKDRLARHLAPAEREAARLAPACVILAYDRDFAVQLIEFLPRRPRPSAFFDNPAAVAAAAHRNGVLHGAYLAVAARAVGLEVAFVRNFDRKGLAGEFFRGPALTPLFVCRAGYPATDSGSA
jgi:nitroreductase